MFETIGNFFKANTNKKTTNKLDIVSSISRGNIKDKKPETGGWKLPEPLETHKDASVKKMAAKMFENENNALEKKFKKSDGTYEYPNGVKFELKGKPGYEGNNTWKIDDGAELDNARENIKKAA